MIHDCEDIEATISLDKMVIYSGQGSLTGIPNISPFALALLNASSNSSWAYIDEIISFWVQITSFNIRMRSYQH
jgi:hypothetical protein